MDFDKIKKTITAVAEDYPSEFREDQLRDVSRMTFHVSLPASRCNPSESTICDIGGGLGLFAPSCGAIGFKRVLMIDDMGDEVNKRAGESIDPIFRKYRVEVISRDVVAQGLGPKFTPNSVDVFTCFESMEHWHHSPKALFGQVMACLRPGGLFILGVPNCVNLRKRLTVPLGIGKWSAMSDWYEKPAFRGHVREPDVADLMYISRDMGLSNARILGRNWLGHAANSRLVRLATKILDLPLRLVPSLCSDIYLVGKKAP